MGDVSFVATYN